MIDLKALRAAGLTSDQIVAVIEATNPIIAELNDLRERLAEIREQNRKRKQNQRSGHVTVTGQKKTEAKSTTVSRDMSRDCHVTLEKPNGINGHVTVTGDNALYLSKEDSKQERKKVERGCRLPEIWVPSEKHFELGTSLGMSKEEVLFHAEAFREWAWSNENRAIGRKANWNLAFNGWLRRERTSKKGSSLFKPVGITAKFL